jgi:hypothetical protein
VDSGAPAALVTDRGAVHEEMDRANTTFHRLIRNASAEDLRRLSAGTRWTNQQLLFHMVFGYLIVLRLLPLVRLLSRLPDSVSRAFAASLEAATRPFHIVNYLGSLGGGTVLNTAQMVWILERSIGLLNRKLDSENEGALQRSMHFPVSWDPFFKDSMSLADVYRFGTQHFDFHQKQLTLGRPQQA